MRLRASAALTVLLLALGVAGCDLDGGAVDAQTLADRAATVQDTQGSGTPAKQKRASATAEQRAKQGRRAVRTARVRERIPAPERTRRTHELRAGATRVLRPGRSGVRVKVFRVVTRDGRVTQRTLVRSRVVRKPVARVVLVGTRRGASVPSNAPCDDNYTGACVPFASDVDCLGGNGDGPGFVKGPVRVVGLDVYDLDPDGDGWGCERR